MGSTSTGHYAGSIVHFDQTLGNRYAHVSSPAFLSFHSFFSLSSFCFLESTFLSASVHFAFCWLYTDHHLWNAIMPAQWYVLSNKSDYFRTLFTAGAYCFLLCFFSTSSSSASPLLLLLISLPFPDKAITSSKYTDVTPHQNRCETANSVRYMRKYDHKDHRKKKWWKSSRKPPLNFNYESKFSMIKWEISKTMHKPSDTFAIITGNRLYG